jgi:hypothetical protein
VLLVSAIILNCSRSSEVCRIITLVVYLIINGRRQLKFNGDAFFCIFIPHRYLPFLYIYCALISIGSTCKSYLMVAALVKCNILPSVAIAENMVSEV